MISAEKLYPHWFCHVGLLCISAFDVAVLAGTNVAVSLHQLWAILAPLAIPLLFVVAVERTSFTTPGIERVCLRAAVFCKGVIFLLSGWIALRLFCHLSMKLTANIDYVDDLLAGWDGALGADWQAYFKAVQVHPWIVRVLDLSYKSLSALSVIAFVVISCSRDVRRPRFFLEAFFTTAVICTVAGMFFPAQGTVMHYLGAESSFSNFATAPGLWFIKPLQLLRSDAAVMLDIHELPGLVTFPSFHVGAVVVMVASFWRTPLFLPALVYGFMVAASTPIFGGHYIVDLLAGTGVSAAVVALIARQKRFEGLFAGAAALRRTAAQLDPPRPTVFQGAPDGTARLG